MNTERTSSDNSFSDNSFRALRPSAQALRSVRVFVACLAAALLLVGLAATASLAGLKPAPAGGTGAVLALMAQLRAARIHAAAGAGGANANSRTPGGRTLLPHAMMHAGAILKARAATTSTPVPISGGVQTYDVSNPPPAFRPLVGYGALGALNNSSSNPPVYVSALTPTNLYPVWSADETFFVFSSNRTQTGGIQPDGRFHLWAISVNGGEAFQITTSTGPAGDGEFFPALSRNNLTLAFISDASSSGTNNLYALPFSYSALSSGAMAPTNLSLSTANPNPPASLTLRAPTEAASAAMTGFDQVGRPTFSPNDDQLIVFTARSVNVAGNGDTYAGHSHLYFLYTSSGGFSQGNNVSFPGKLTDGPADDTDPTYAPDGSYIAFASTANANGFTRNPNNAFGPTNPAAVQDPNDSQSLSSGANTTHSLFLISGGLSTTGVPFGTVPTGAARLDLSATGGRVSQGSAAGFDDFAPAWSSFANQNQYTNPSGNFAYLAFARSNPAVSANHDIYFFQVATGVSDPTTEALVPETAGAGSANAAVQLNTDDKAGQTSAGGNAYDDIYPTWSPFLSIFSIAYMSNRTVTYNNPAGSAPVEVAASVAQGGTVTNAQDATTNYSVGTSYEGLLVSQVLNLDPPTLLRFSPDEVVHVQAGSNPNPVTGTPNKLAATGGQSVTLTVRLSDREAGISDTGGPGGGPRVYVQIKDPDSKYQDSQNVEHKVFVKDLQYNGQRNQPLYDVNSGTANSSLGSEFSNYGAFGPFDFRRYTYPSYGPVVNNIQVGYVRPRGVHGGSYPPGANNPGGPPGTYIFVGRDAGGTNPNMADYGGGPVTIPNGDPRLYIPWGPEYECQVVNPQFLSGGTGNTMPNTAGITNANPAGTIGDYVSPYYLAGVDDQQAFSGGTYDPTAFTSSSSRGRTGTDRPVAGYTTTNTPPGGGANTTTTHPAEWLQLNRVAPAQQDNLGGVLYTVTWTTPSSGSDFYVDVIAYDNAVFPAFPANTSPSNGRKTNWRIYDNVGGFSTNSSIGGNDILLVSDYALGQKFAATTFGGRNLNLNLVPKVFGTESYLTDVDVDILPNSVYGGVPTTAASYQFNPALLGFVGAFASGGSSYGGVNYPISFVSTQTFGQTQNGLGVGSYIDSVIDDQTRVTDSTTGVQNPNVQSQRYSIWRILSRGPVPASLLQSYTPTPVSQPAIADAADPAYAKVPAATILSAPRCVIWLSPYTGDVLADPGTLDDPGTIGTTGTANARSSTTSILTNFVQGGGRLFITGQDVGSTLTQGGTVNNTPGAAGTPNFLPDVLNATLSATTGGTNVLAATNNRITGPPTYDGFFGNFGSGESDNFTFTKGGLSGNIFGPQYAYQDNLVLGDADYGDGAFSQIPSLQLPGGASVQGQIDIIAPANGATTAISYGANGPAALIYHDDPYKVKTSANGAVIPPTLPNGGTGSRVVYGAFGLEGLSNDYFTVQDPDPSSDVNNAPAFDQRIPPVAARNPRPQIIHNIVSFLRTGNVSGTITQTAGTGQGGGLGIDGVTVYLRPASGNAPSTRVAFSALTANGGRFTIAGVEPGTYTLVAIKPGFQRAVSNSGIFFSVEGDTTVNGATLTMTPQQPGNIAGTVQDPAGKPISGSTVTFTSQDNSITKTAVTANGSVPGSTTENYFIQGVPVTNYTGTASSPLNPTNNQPEYTAAAAPDAPNAAGIVVQPNTTTQPVNFTLTPILGTISGTVTNSTTGAPINQASVSITTSAGQSLGAVQTNPDGTYTLPNVPAAAYPTATTYTVAATATGFATSAPLTETVYLGSVLTGVNFPLAPIPPGSIKATVLSTNPAGAPVANAVVSYSAPGVPAQTVTTGADGTVTIPNLPPGTYTVSAVGLNNTSTPSRPTTTAAPAQQITVTAGQQAAANFAVTPIPPSFSGTVTNASGAPFAGVTITVTDANGTPVATTPSPDKTGADGTYTTGPLAPGTYTVTASRAGYGSVSIGPTAVQEGDVLTGQNFTLAAVPPGSIMGVVKDNNGLPVANAVVTFSSTDGTVPGQTATTDGGGNYLIPPAPTAPNVPASTYTGNAVGPVNDTGTPEYGSDPSAPKTATVPSGGSATVNFTLPIIPASVSGTVTDVQTGAVVPNATVTLTGPSGAAVGAPVTTGPNGAYAFTGIVANQSLLPYTLTATATGYSATTTTVSLALGDMVTLPVALNEKATLYGLVTDGSPDVPTHPALSGVTITVTDTGGNVVATVPAVVTTPTGPATGPDGAPANYLANLLPGTYTVTASKGNFDSKTSAVVTLNNVTAKRVDLALISSIGTIGGLVTDQNGAAVVGGATVTLTQAGQTTGLTFTTSATASTGPDGQPLNYTGLVAKGTYSVTVTKGNRTSAAKTITIAGGTFNRLDFSGVSGLPALHTFTAGVQFFSTPYDYSAIGFNGLFGAVGVNRTNVAVWNPVIGAYALDPNPPADTLRLGVGYWIDLRNATAITQQGATPTAAYVAVPLGQGWNQIGVPNPSSAGVPISSLKFDNGAGGMISFQQASGSQYNLITRPLYEYISPSYQALSPNDATGTLMPWMGYWIYANAPATLEIPTR